MYYILTDNPYEKKFYILVLISVNINVCKKNILYTKYI